MKRLSIFLLLILLLSSATSYAQGYRDLSRPNVVPSSPQSQIFEKYINHEVTEYNGLPDISIPLYVIEIKGLKIPVALTYHAAGIKYKQFDGDLGAGWSINAGGYRVSRTIYGKPDEEFPFYDKSVVQSYMTSARSPYSRDSLLTSIGLNMYMAGQMEPDIRNYKDGEYDQFTYMLPSTSGHFIISDRTTRGVSIVSENQDLVALDEGENKLVLENVGITDNAGMKYFLGRTDLSPRSVETVLDEAVGHNVTSSWLLSRIESPFNEYVLFKYNNHQVHTERFKSKYYRISDAEEHSTSNYPLANNPGLETYYSAHMDNQYNLHELGLSLVSSIETDNVIVTFTRGNVYACHTTYTSYVSCSEHVITEITVKDKKSGALLKKITFDYTKSPSNSNANKDEVPWHRLLSAVSIKDGNSANVQKYQFEYYPAPNAPASTYPDQWGYYKTGYTNTSIFPDMYLHNEFKTDNILTRIGRSTVTKTPFGQCESSVPFVDRSTSEVLPNFFSLKRIIYPSGGFTEYEYESNSYGTGTRGGGLRIKKITSQTDASTKALVSEFTYGDSGNGVLSGYLNRFQQCFVDEIFYFSSLRASSFGEKRSLELGTRQAIKTYGSKSFDKDTELFLKVSYNKVAKRQYDAGSNIYLGKTVSTYDIPKEYELSYENNYPNVNMGDRIFRKSNYLGYGVAFTKKYRVGYKPLLTSRTVYNEGGAVLSKDDFQYIELGKTVHEGINIRQKVFFEEYPGITGQPRNCTHYNSISSLYDWGYYTIESGIRKLSGQVSVNYDQNGQNPVATTSSYSYDGLKRLIKSTQTDSSGGILSKEFTYPASGTALNSKNMVATVVKTVMKNKGTETECIVHDYPSTSILPAKTQHSNGSGIALKTDITYDSYDSHGNLLQYTRPNGTKVSYLYGYNYQYPIAEIENASLSDIYAYIPKATIDGIASKTIPAATDWTAISNLQKGMKSALISIYKYKPLVGITEVTAPNGFITYYEYDAFGRLTRTYYKEGSSINTIELYNYNYINKL